LSTKDLSNKLAEAKNDLDTVRTKLAASEAEVVAQKVALDRERDTVPGMPIYRHSKGVTDPSIVYKVDPEYSEDARKAKYGGKVILFVVIGPDGSVLDTWVSKGLGMGLDEKAMESVRKWKFKPATSGGNPVNFIAPIEINFRLL
jgi:TonB family protein